nr:MAG TPA: hypothetical protein [Caudoviricetes sp.]
MRAWRHALTCRQELWAVQLRRSAIRRFYE